MLVSLFTDASFFMEHKAGGWGAWVKSERGRRYGGGPLKGDVSSVNIAEMKAICNGLVVGVQHGIIKSWDTVLIQTDSITAIRRFENNYGTDPEVNEIVEFLEKFIKEKIILVKFKHIKGHVSREQSRHFCNDVCDRLARDGALRAIKLKQKQHASL